MNHEVAMQIRCVNCGLEQYAPAVYLVSMGEYPCVFCGIKSNKMTKKEYEEKIQALKSKK